MIDKIAKGVLNIDPNAKGTFQRTDWDEKDPINVAIQVVDTILGLIDKNLKLVLWETQKELMAREMIMLPTEIWDRIFADPTIGPTLDGYAKMPKEFYYNEDRHSFVIGVDEHKPKDPFDDACPL